MFNRTAAQLFERPNTKRRIIGEMCEQGLSKIAIYRALEPLVVMQEKPWIFSANLNGRRIPKQFHGKDGQFQMLRDEIGRVFALMGRAETAAFESKEIPASPVSEPSPVSPLIPPLLEIEDEDMEEEIEEMEEEIEEKPVAKGKQAIQDELNYFLRRFREIRDFCKLRADQSEAIDDLGIRPAQAASKLIPAGIPADALLSVMALSWPEDTRQSAGIPDFDFVALSRQIMFDRGIDPTGKHEMFGYVLVLAENRIPVYLYGPMGTGKSHLAEQIANYLNLPYGETALSAGATRGDLLGRLTANSERSFILSKFCEIYSGGGVFCFEEIDAGLPEVLIALNNAMAGNRMANSSNGEDYDRHPDFIPIATANTLGLGGNRIYLARERLDGATLDRWRMGRVFMDVDDSLVEDILFGRI